MQSPKSQSVRQRANQFWLYFQTVFSRCAQPATGKVHESEVDKIVIDFIGNQHQQSVNHIIEIKHRIKVDESASISYLELGNFILIELADMTLQIMHHKKQMSQGSSCRKMNAQELNSLMKKAYSFLDTKMPEEATNLIFQKNYINKDHSIAYDQFSKIIDRLFCKRSLSDANDQDISLIESSLQNSRDPESFRKLRILLSKILNARHQTHDDHQLLETNIYNLIGLIVDIIGQVSEKELSLILKGFSNLQNFTAKFEALANQFLFLVAQFALDQFKPNKPNQATSKKNLNKFEFLDLFKNTYSFLEISLLSKQYLWEHFAKINKDKDGLITYDQYLNWVKRFIEVVQSFGNDVLFQEDDKNLYLNKSQEKKNCRNCSSTMDASKSITAVSMFQTPKSKTAVSMLQTAYETFFMTFHKLECIGGKNAFHNCYSCWQKGNPSLMCGNEQCLPCQQNHNVLDCKSELLKDSQFLKDLLDMADLHNIANSKEMRFKANQNEVMMRAEEKKMGEGKR